MSRILVVEDEANIALGLQDDLTLEGYEVVLARDGDEALRAARGEAFDLIVLDLMLPRKDGLTVCRELRRGGLKTPIIMLTARAQEAEKVLGLELGADDYVTKPFSPIELRARIKAVLRRAGDAAALPQVYRFGDAELDFGRCELRRAGRTVELTAIEVKLLAAFVRSRGLVLSRDQLLDAAWGLGTHVTDRVVDSHIVMLRRKIEPDPAEPRYLTSVRGMGYRFDG
jgi:DNA-binding response OmpR family regulator